MSSSHSSNDDQPGSIGDLTRLTRLGIEHNRDHARDVTLNLAFLSGKQYSKFSRSQGVLPIENEANEIRVIDNKMIQAYQWKIQQYFKQRPTLTAFGSGNELIDEEAADVASRMGDHWRVNNGWLEAEREAAGWLEVSGMVYIAPVWRNKPGIEKEFKSERLLDNSRLNESGQKTFIEHKVIMKASGDLAFDVFNTLQTFTYPLGETRWNRVAQIITADIVPYQWLRHHLRIDIDKEALTKINHSEINVNALDNFRHVLSSETSGFSSSNYLGEDRYLLIQYRERPTPEYPKGRFIVVVGGQKIIDDPLPYVRESLEIDPNDNRNLTMGLVPWFAYDMPGRLIPVAPMTILREHQIIINNLKTDEKQNRDTIGRNKIFYEQGTIDDEAFTDEHGEMIPVDPGLSGKMNVQIIQGQPLVGIASEIARAELSFDAASGRSSLFQGQNPPQVRSAFHLDILREEGQSQMEFFIRQREMNHENVARLALAIGQRRYSIKRIIEIYGKDRAGQALTYKRASIRTDIIVKEGSSLPRNKAAKEAKALELFQRGAFVDPQTGKQNTNMLWDMLELGSLNRSVDHENKQKLRARQENKMILFGDIEENDIMPFEYEDHALHLIEHIGDMARPEFYDASDEIKALYMTHIDAHNDFLADQIAPESMEPPETGAGDIKSAIEDSATELGVGVPGLQLVNQ